MEPKGRFVQHLALSEAFPPAASLQRLVEQRQIAALRGWLGEDHDLLRRLDASDTLGPCSGAAIDPRPGPAREKPSTSGGAAAPLLPARTTA